MSGLGIPGLGSGIDWTKYMDSIRAAEEGAVARTLGRKSAKVASQSAIFGQVKGLLSALQSGIDDFSSSSDFKVKSVNSSDSNVVTATANLSAVNGPTTIRVDQLATNEEWQLEATGVDNSISATGGTFTITVRGVTTNLTVAAGTTLKQLADQINAANIGVTAQTFDTGAGGATPARLAIKDNKLGKFNADQTPDQNFNITIGSPSGDLSALNPAGSLALRDGNAGVGGYQPTKEGLDSKFYLNGNTTDPIYRDSNTLLDVISGVTINLVGTDNANFKTLTVTESTGQAAQKLQSLLRAYNDVVVNLRKATAFDPNAQEQTNPTAGDGTLRSALSQIQNAFTGTVTSIPLNKTIRNITDLGVKRMVSGNSRAGDGQVELDESKLNAAIGANYDDVLAFFQGGTLTGSTERYDGFVKRLKDVLDGLLSSTKGSITGKIDSLNEQSKRITEDINTKVDRINRKQEMLKAKFARLETEMSNLNGQQSQLQSAINAIGLNNQAIARNK